MKIGFYSTVLAAGMAYDDKNAKVSEYGSFGAILLLLWLLLYRYIGVIFKSSNSEISQA